MKTTIVSMALLLTCCGQPFTAAGVDGAGGKFAVDVAVDEPASPAVGPTSLPPPIREEDAGAPRPAVHEAGPSPTVAPPIVSDDAGPPAPTPTTTAKPDAGPPPPPPPPAACGLLGGRHGLLCGSACPSPVQGFETASCGQAEACSAPPIVFSPGRDWNDDATIVLEATDSTTPCVLPLPDGGWYVAGPTLRSAPGTCLKATVDLPRDLAGKVVRGVSSLSGAPTFGVCATSATGDVRVVAISGAPVGLVMVRVSSLGLDGSCPLSC